MTTPYLSILLPTKNRSHLVGLAVRSVRQQDFHDYELIICDNDDDPAATRTAVEKYLDDPRVNYIRTGGLSMIDNWNAALDASSGRYITVLEDKMIFYPGALTTLCAKIQKSPSGVVVWRYDTIDDDYDPPKLKMAHDVEDTVLQSGFMLAALTKDIMKQWPVLPRGLASVVPRDIIELAKQRYGGDFYQPISPDFVSALKILSLVDAYLLTGSTLNLVTSNRVSNGKLLLMRKETDHSYMQGTGELEFDFSLVPVRSQLIVANVLTIDYRKAASAIGGKLEQFPVAHKDYLSMMTRELLETTVAARGVVWTKREILELIRSNNSPIANTFQMLYWAFRVLCGSAAARLRIGGTETAQNVIRLDQEPLDLVDQFLSGKKNLANRPSFTPPE